MKKNAGIQKCYELVNAGRIELSFEKLKSQQPAKLFLEQVSPFGNMFLGTLYFQTCYEKRENGDGILWQIINVDREGWRKCRVINGPRLVDFCKNGVDAKAHRANDHFCHCNIFKFLTKKKHTVDK